MAERPLYTLYKNLKAQNYDVPDDYNKFESALTRDGKSGADNRHAIYENLKAQNFDVPSTYERFYSALFVPRSKTSSRAKGGSVPMSAADRARFSAGAAAISASAKQIANNAGRYNRLKQRKQKQQKDFGRVNLGTHLTPFGGDANNVVKDEFAYNPETGKAGAYVTSDNKNAYTQSDAEQKQAILDQQDAAYQQAVDTGEIPSAFDVRDKNGNYDLQENIGNNGTYLTEEGAQKQFDKKLADAYARKKEIEALIAEDNRQHGNPLLSYSASIGAGNGRTAEQSDYRNKLATSLSLVTEQIGALEAVKQYPTSSWGEDVLKALDNTAFTAKTWDFGLTDFATMGQMERIKTKMDNNIPLSGSDKMLMKSKLGADAAAALEDEKMGNVYRWTKIAGQSLPFMADFFLTGGYGGVSKAIGHGALKFAAKRGMGKVSAAILKNTGIVAGDVIGSYAMAGTEQAMKTGADIMQRHLGNLYQDEKGDYKFGTFDENGNLLHEGGESMGTALYKGLTSAMVENYTEKLFGHNYGIKKGAIAAMEKHGMDGTAQFFKNIGKSGWYTNSKKWMEKFGINGFGEEVMEEEIGIPLHALLDGDNNFSDLGDAKQQLDIIGGMAISVGSMYAMGAGSRPVKGIYNRAQYYRFRNKVNVADIDAQNLMGDNWADIKDKIDNATNEQMGGVLADILRQRDTMTKEQINAAVNYGVNLMKMRGYNIAKTAEMNAREITNEPTTPEEQHQADIDNAYSEGHDADDADKHDIQIQQEDQMKTLAAALGISEQQLSGMSDEELESLTGQDDKLDQAIYDYQLSTARYQGVIDDAQDKVDIAAHQAAQKVDMYTDQSRGSVRNATIKASGGLEDYGVYIISGNIATHDDGSIDVSNSDDMILYFDPTTNSVEHADALMFAELGEELPADDVKAQAVADAKENAIKEVAGIIDGTVEVGSQFSVTDADGTEHTYEVLADNGDGTAMITIDGNVPTELVKGENVQIPYSFADLQQLKDAEDLKRLEAAKAEREQMEKERDAQQTQETEQTQPSFDFNQILNDDGNVVLVDVLDEDGNTKYPDSKLFLIRDTGAKAKVMELKSDGSLVPHAVNKEDVAIISSMSLDEYKQAFAESSMIEDNSGENRGEIEVESPTIEGETAAPEATETPATEQTPAAPAITLEDGTIVPMLEDGNPDFSKLTAAQTAELYDNQFGEDADSIVSGYVSDAKKALDKANNMTVKGKTFVEQKAAKDAKEKAIADAQAAYDSAIAIRDAYNERQLAKVEDTAEGRKKLIEKARRKFARLKSAVKDDAEAVAQIYKETVGSLLHRLYDGTGIDVTDTIPLTAEEYVASNLGAHSLNYEGTETSKSVKQETGLSREDFAKTQLLAADGKGTTIDNIVHSLWENRPSNLETLGTQDIRNALIDVLTSGFKASEARSYVENIRIAQAEKLIEEERTAAENAAYYEQQKAKEEEEKKKAELENKAEEEKKKAEENIDLPAIDKQGEPINNNIIELAKWAKKQGLEIDPTSKLNSYADLFLMCKDGFGVSTLVPDEGKNINQVIYFPDNAEVVEQLGKLQEEFNAGRDLNHSSNIDSEITEGATFYDAATAKEFRDFVNEQTNFPDKLKEGSKAIEVPEDATDDAPLGEQLDETDLPFSAKENGKQQATSERAADVEKNKVDDMKVVDNIVGQKTRKAFERLAKMMGANIQWQYSDKLGNGWIQETKDADGNVHRTIFITLDSSITEGAQFIFGHEMTHQIKNLNPAAYNELTQLVLDTYGSDAFDKAVDETMQRYSDAGFSGRSRDYYAEEVVADSVGEMIRDLNLTHTLAMKMSHPLLAAIHEILQKIKLAFFGTEYSDVTKNIIRSIEQAYVKTANGQVTNSETGEDVSFSLRQKPEPKKKGIGYKVFVLKDGKLYPPMVANPDGAATPVGVWLDADAAPIAGESKTGRPQVKQGGKGTQGGSGKLAYRPGWHLGVVPYAIQFNRKDAEGNKTLFPKTFVFAEVEYAADVDYQEEARQEGINPSGKYQHSLAGLKHLPTDGYYMYRTNPNPETDPWVITGAMKVNRILTRAEQAELVKNAGREPQQIQEGDIVTDDVVNSINQEIADAPKFSLKDIKPVGVGAFGNIYNQFRGKAKAAIEFLKKLGSGEATAALHHHTIGDISLVWGDKKTGLDKILRKHPEVVDNLQSIIDSMEVVQESDNRIKLESPTHFAVVSKEYKGEPREQWLLTAYEKRESLENGKSMDTATSSLGGDTALSQSKESAAKIDNSPETAKENGEKFSLKDEKTLAGVHNISEEKLLKAIKQGGLANPSVAVIDSSKQDHKAYGGISLILPSDKIAKRTGKNAGTWQGDAYTPTYPEVEKQMSNKGAEKSSSDVLSVPKEMQHEVRNGIDRWLNGGDANSGLKYLFLHEKGVAPEPRMIQPKFGDEAYNELKFITAGDFNIYGIGKADSQKVLDMYIEAKFDGDKDLYEEKTKAWLERNKSIVDAGAKGGMRYAIAKENVELYDEYGFNYKGVQTFVRDVEYDHRKSGVDTNATLNDVEDYIKTNNLTDEFNTWLEGKEKEYGIKEVIFDGFTPSGNRRYVPNTLENVSKLMKKQGRNGATGAAVSFQNFAARLMPSYGTLKDIRSKKGLLTSDREKFDKFREKWSNVFFELGNKCQPDSTSAFDSYGMERLSEAAMTSDPQAYLKKEYNVDFSDADTKRLKEMVKAIKEEHPAMYFETKFERPVRFDEFSAAVVPTTTKKEVKEALENAGVSIFEYDEKSDADRKRAFNEAINSSDNIRFSLAGERGAAAADKAEERTARMNNLSVARKMEEEKKDSKAIKMATGWELGADGKWRYEMPDAKIKDTINVGGGQIVKRYEDDMLWNGGKLSDVIDAPELFKAYPQLKDVLIETDAIMNDMPSNGEYNSKTNIITIHADELKYMNGILNHEIQHAIQDIEGFAKGGSPRLVRGEVKKKLNEVTKQIRQLRAEGKEDEAKALVEKNRGLYNAYQKNDDFNSYKSLAGEVEARNVQERMNMTPEERRKSLAESTEDVARKDQIFLGVGDVSFSLRDMADGKESGAADMAEDLKSLNTPDEVDDAIKTAIDDMPSGWKMANKKMIHIAQALGENRKAEIAGEEPKFSLKDGSLIKAGTYFSGGGLVEEGLKGIIDPVIAVEYDEKISGVYRNNFGQHIVTADVRDVDPKELVKQIDGEVEYFHASPVCKNYSQAKSNHAEVELDKETAASTAEFINAVKPKVVTIENVKGYKDSEAMKIITDALDANGYTWDADVYNAADYGGYTNRERLIVRAVRYGKLPAKPEKMARKSGWYEAVADIIPTLTEKKNGVAPWMDIRLKADGIDWRNIDKPLYVMGSAYADGKIPHAFADELLPTLRTKSGDVIVMPDGKVYRAMGRVLARVSGVSDDYKMPFSENLSHTIIGNGIPTQLTEHVIAPLLQNSLRPTTPDDGNTRFSLRYDQFEHDLNQWKKDNNLPKDAQRPTIPQRNAGESAVDFLRRVDEYRKQMALWKTAPTYEQHLLSDDTALGEFNRELQRGSVLKRIAFQDSMLAIRKAQEAIMKEVGVDRLNMAEDAYTAENRSHGKGKNEFEEYNNEFLQPLRKAYHQMKKVLGDSYDNVRIYMMAKHGLERDAQMAFKKSLEADYEDVAQRSAAYKAYKGDMNRMGNDSGFELGYIDFNTWRQRDNALRVKYSPSYMNYRYDKMGIAYDYSGLSALFGGSDFEEAASKLVRDIESSHVVEVQDLWNATNAATKKILRDGYKAGMMSKDTYQYVRDMYSHYIPLRGWDGTTADQVWDYIGGGKGAFNQTLKTAHGRTSIADDPIAYIENMAESGILLNNKNWVKQHLMLLAQNHPTSLLTLSKAWYVKSTDANGNEEWIPATPQITSQMDSNQVKAAIDAFEKKMEQMAQTGDATQKRDGLNIAYPQTHSEEREHEVRVMKDGEEYVIYVNGDPQLAQAMNNTRAHRVREIQSGKLDRAAAWLGRKMAAAYTSLSPLFIPSNYFRDLTMTLASTAIREDAKYNYLLRKNLATSWNLGFILRDYQNGKLRDKVNNGNATPKEQMFYDFMMNGGETGFVSSLDVEDLKKKFKNDLKDLDRWKTNPVKVGHTIMDGIEFLNRAIEDSNRFAVYMTSIQYGRSIDEAVNDAKDVTLNFNRKGTGEYGWQMIRNLYLFINPAVQSLQTLGALVKHHPFKFTAVTASWLASGVLVPVVNAALMSLLGGDDDKDKYWQFTKWDRRNNLIMWVPFTHEYVKIPLAQEFRAFYGVGDMIASKMMGGELAEESWSQYAEDLLGQVVDMLPLDPTGYDGNIAVSLMPNAIRPVFELAFNVDFTGKPLFKDTEYNKYDPNFTKAYVGTPDWLVRASRMMNSIGNDYPDVQQNKWDALGDPRYNLNNPAVVDHVLSSYLGGAYTMGSQVLGVLTKSLNDPKEIKVADIPLFSKFVSNPDDRPVTKKQGDEFWNMKENHDRAANTLSKLKKQAKVDGDYSMLERFYCSEEYKQYKQDDVKVKKYEEDKKKERAEESGEEYRPHKLNAEDIYKAHATPKDDFEDLKLKQLYTKLNGFKTSYDLLVDTAPNQSEGYYNTNKAAIDAIDEISLDKQEISELKKGFLDDGKDAYNAEDMKQIRDLRKKILAVLEKANKVVVANQKAKAKKK